MAARVQKPAVVMLAMQFDQRLGQGAQHLATGAAVVDPGGLAAIGGVHPPQKKLRPAGQPGLFQHAMRSVTFGQIEGCCDLALLGPLPHQIGASAPAQHEAKGIKQDGFTGPGFAGQHVQTGLELKLQPVDDQHVPDVQPAQHLAIPLPDPPQGPDHSHLP